MKMNGRKWLLRFVPISLAIIFQLKDLEDIIPFTIPSWLKGVLIASTFFFVIWDELFTKKNQEIEILNDRIKKVINEHQDRLTEQEEKIESQIEKISKESEEKGFKKGKQQNLKDLLEKEDLLDSLLEELGNLFKHFITTDHLDFKKEIAKNLTTFTIGFSGFLKKLLPKEEGNYKLWSQSVLKSLEEYFEGLKELLIGNGTNDPILPSEFSHYAKCVGAILKSTKDILLDANFNHHITIRTILNPPITKWYNITYIPNGDFYITGDWWEQYKETVREFADANQRIQIKRLIGVDSKNDNNDSAKIIYQGKENEVTAKNLADIIDLQVKKSGVIDGVNLIPECGPRKGEKSMEAIDQSKREAYIIGLLADGQVEKTNWIKAIQDFESRYHSVRSIEFNPRKVRKNENGVFRLYANQAEIYSRDFLNYDDIFLVTDDSTDDPKYKSFGIVFEFRGSKGMSGFRFLKPNEADEAAKSFDKAWKEIGRKTIEDVIAEFDES